MSHEKCLKCGEPVPPGLVAVDAKVMEGVRKAGQFALRRMLNVYDALSVEDCAVLNPAIDDLRAALESLGVGR